MPTVQTFQEVVDKTKGQHRAILIGNGFSADYFSYKNLLDESELDKNTPVHKLFTNLKTNDFELVIRSLEASINVERAYGNHEHAKELKDDANIVREALVKAINKTHPKHREDLGAKYTNSAKFLGNFKSVFSLNYDLLLYWTNLEKEKLRDGFGLGTDIGSFIKPFREDAYCNLFNVHGGLHLFDDGTGQVMKAVNTGEGVIATITNTIEKDGLLPIYVAEGTSQKKLKKINSNRYLRYCYDKLIKNTSPIFIYGHSADDNDKHIYDAIFGSKTPHIYFGVYDETKLAEFDGILTKYQKVKRSQIEYSFFDSKSAAVWEITTDKSK